jgi:hypothetical protein
VFWMLITNLYISMKRDADSSAVCSFSDRFGSAISIYPPAPEATATRVALRHHHSGCSGAVRAQLFRGSGHSPLLQSM